jgi:hypothetical protein
MTMIEESVAPAVTADLTSREGAPRTPGMTVGTPARSVPMIGHGTWSATQTPHFS